MARIVLYMSMSLDGFISDPDDGVEHLHAWLGDGGVDPESYRPSSGPSATVFDEMMATGTDGIGSCVTQAKAAAGDRDVMVHGANCGTA